MAFVKLYLLFMRFINHELLKSVIIFFDHHSYCLTIVTQLRALSRVKPLF